MFQVYGIRYAVERASAVAVSLLARGRARLRNEMKRVSFLTDEMRDLRRRIGPRSRGRDHSSAFAREKAQIEVRFLLPERHVTELSR